MKTGGGRDLTGLQFADGQIRERSVRRQLGAPDMVVVSVQWEHREFQDPVPQALEQEGCQLQSFLCFLILQGLAQGQHGPRVGVQVVHWVAGFMGPET